MTDTLLALRINQFCARIGISPATFWKYHKLGKIRSIRIGTRVLIPMIEVNRIVTEGLN
jgi:predicted site-specific integrase-resolvase